MDSPVRSLKYFLKKDSESYPHSDTMTEIGMSVSSRSLQACWKRTSWISSTMECPTASRNRRVASRRERSGDLPRGAAPHQLLGAVLDQHRLCVRIVDLVGQQGGKPVSRLLEIGRDAREPRFHRLAVEFVVVYPRDRDVVRDFQSQRLGGIVDLLGCIVVDGQYRTRLRERRKPRDYVVAGKLRKRAA